jgi:hypothetical protein
MAESKSSYFFKIINTYSEKAREFDINTINRLAADSECRRRAFADPYL